MRFAYVVCLLVSSFNALAQDTSLKLQDAEAETQETPPQVLQVVKSYADLFKQPAIPFEEGRTGRFGISATSAPKGGGLLVYALIDPYDPSTERDGGSTPDEQKLGPFQVDVNWEPELQKENLAQEQQQQVQMLARPKGAYLLLQSVPMTQAGKGIVSIKLPSNSREIAKVEIKGTTEPFHPWLQLTSPEAVQKLQEAAEENLRPLEGELFAVFETDATVRALSPSLPKWSNESAVFVGKIDPESSHAKLPLPKLWEDTDTADGPATLKWPPVEIEKFKTLTTQLGAEEFEQRVSAEDRLLFWALESPALRRELEVFTQNSVELEARQRTRHILRTFEPAFTIAWEPENRNLELAFKNKITPEYEFRDKLLARWWVNGKPFVPEAEQLQRVQADLQRAQQEVWTRLVDLHLILDEDALKDLKAKSGDEIELQLLYCPDGIRSVDEKVMEQLAQMIRESDPREPQVPLLSNRIKFVMPAPEKHVQEAEEKAAEVEAPNPQN